MVCVHACLLFEIVQGFCGWCVCLWCVLGVVNLEKKDIYFLPCTHARDTGGPGAFACNLAIFFGKLVTCTHYGATYWGNLQGTVYFPGGSTPIVPTKSPVVNKIIYYLTIYLYILIIKVIRLWCFCAHGLPLVLSLMI